MEKEKQLANIHPGEILKEDFLIPMDLSQNKLAKAIGVPAMRISEICNGKRAITMDTAIRLARYFGTSYQLWMGLQADYDYEEANKKYRKSYTAIRSIREENRPTA